MNILFVSSQFPNSLQPNRGIFSLQIVRELARLAEVKVVAPLPTLGWLRALDSCKRHKTVIKVPEAEEISAIPVLHPRYLAVPGLGLLHQWGYQTAVAALIRELHDRWPIDAINCHWLFPDGVAVQRVAARLGIPVMLTPLGTDLNEYGGYPIRRFFIRWALQRAARVSVLNSAMHAKCLDLGVSEERIATIANGVDSSRFFIQDRGACRRKLKLADHASIILFVGSLTTVKNVETLLKAFALLQARAHSRPLLLYLVGAGHLEESLQALATDLGVQGRAVFMGAVPHADLPVWMNGADCLCLPSHSEGHPNVMMEALACGTPVVGSAVGSIPDFVGAGRGNGFTFSASDVDSLAARLGSCLGRDYDRQAVRQSVLPYSWSACAESYHRELLSIAAAPSSGRLGAVHKATV